MIRPKTAHTDTDWDKPSDDVAKVGICHTSQGERVYLDSMLHIVCFILRKKKKTIFLISQPHWSVKKK